MTDENQQASEAPIETQAAPSVEAEAPQAPAESAPTEAQEASPEPAAPLSADEVFESAVAYVLVNEGGYSNDPNDSGGPTNHGITQQDLTRFKGMGATIAEVQQMTVDTAKAVYRKFYWNPMLGDAFTQVPVVTAVFDTCVLYGEQTGKKYAQEAANACGSGLVVDEVFGPKTLAALNHVDPKAFVKAFHSLVIARIEAIEAAHPKDKVFDRGWRSRADRLLSLV